MTTEAREPGRGTALSGALEILADSVRSMRQDWDPSAGAQTSLRRRFINFLCRPQSAFNRQVIAALESAQDLLGHLNESKAAAVVQDRLAEEFRLLDAENRELRSQLQRVQSQLESLRGLADSAMLEHRLSRLERNLEGSKAVPQVLLSEVASVPASYSDAIDYFKFEARFRGPRDIIRERHRIYLPYVEGQAPVLDIGCGRGEFLELLKHAGIQGRGVDLERDMAEFCRSIGLEVDHDDAFAYLQRLPEASLGAIFLGQVVEHMTPSAVATLFGLAMEKLRPGGVLIAETVNPICPTALANFYLDPTHERPVHPDLLMFLAESKGFEAVEFLFSSSPASPETTLRAHEGQPAGGDRFMDFAIIVRRPLSTC